MAELRGAHERRLERMRTLQAEHKLVLQQLQTFEQNGRCVHACMHVCVGVRQGTLYSLFSPPPQHLSPSLWSPSAPSAGGQLCRVEPAPRVQEGVRAAEKNQVSKSCLLPSAPTCTHDTHISCTVMFELRMYILNVVAMYEYIDVQSGSGCHSQCALKHVCIEICVYIPTSRTTAYNA